MDLKLKSKTALITGSARGIGASIAKQLTEEGVRVVISDINASGASDFAKTLCDGGAEAFAVPIDVCDPLSVDAAFKKVQSDFGHVDILVNNAGFTRDNYLGKMPASDWAAVIDVVLNGAFNCTRAALPHMMEKRWGRIINISSRALFGNPGQTNYSAAKLGLIGFTRALALEQGRFGVTANAVAPGFIETDLIQSLPSYPKIKQRALERNPVGFVGAPGDIAAAVAFLASPLARYITGTTMLVTGGRFSS